MVNYDMKRRKITNNERELINQILLSWLSQSKGRNILVGEQVEEIDTEGSIKFIHSSEPISILQKKIPVEARVQDVDGIWVHALLFLVDNNKVDELDIYKDDSSPILKKLKYLEWEIID